MKFYSILLLLSTLTLISAQYSNYYNNYGYPNYYNGRYYSPGAYYNYYGQRSYYYPPYSNYYGPQRYQYPYYQSYYNQPASTNMMPYTTTSSGKSGILMGNEMAGVWLVCHNCGRG
ncbi:unnamed protein product [Bursaphelenchus okinawaensis]|uniref:Uncharacterized protein n=1 Tax=Bursaphelenchus okinawaensis TaxID=465554 RepID=A0A811L0R5_9BILA|nr:unnamed protein product [Bursaphelenchus okinawaensis]CAG9115402.1 unnamed protein product [Bursaphelenchus okinawaensis]